VTDTSALIAWALIDEHLRPIALIGLGCATLGVAGLVEAACRQSRPLAA
jgi:hypothetical protein